MQRGTPEYNRKFFKSRTNHVTLLGEGMTTYRHKIPDSSILFMDKEYPICSTHKEKYLVEIGCIWCKMISHGTR